MTSLLLRFIRSAWALQLALLAALALAPPLLSAQPVVAQARNMADNAAALAGWWEEYSPSSNIIQFLPDGTVRLYLKKGEIGNLRSLDGTWKLGDDKATVRMVFSVAGKSLDRSATLSFEGAEMVLTDGGTQTRHRRHSGKLPAVYSW